MNAHKRILLVDDNDEIREMLADTLESQNLEIVQAQNGSIALELVSLQTFDFIITDCDMPVMNGLEFTKRMKEKGITTPIAMFSGNDDAKERFIGALGGSAFFDKLEINALQKHVKQTLESERV